jgi:hypothetical protein
MKFLYLLIIILIFSTQVKSQDLRTNYKYKSDYAFALGITTLQLLGDNPAMDEMRYSEKYGTAGGGFAGAQTGIDLRVTRYLDDEDKHRIPLGVSFTFFSAGSRTFQSGRDAFYKFAYRHDLLLADIYTGWHYSFLRFPLGNAQMWAGVELHGVYVSDQTYSLEYSEIEPRDELLRKSVNTKDDQFRIGPLFRLGIDGELQERIMINMSGGIQLLNLFLRDDSQGNLLLAKKGDIKNETYAWAFNFSLLVQYRL